MVNDSRVPVGVIGINRKAKASDFTDQSFEPIYGGYVNARGQVSLFAERCTYRVNFKNQTLQLGTPLNPGAQANYDAVKAGEPFLYANREFLRLSQERITEICASGVFRLLRAGA